MSDRAAIRDLDPERVWDLIDEKLLSIKLKKIDELMRGRHASDESEVQEEARLKGNSAFYPQERCRREVALADDWAEMKLSACLEVWKTQGLDSCPGLFRAVHPK